MRITRVYTGAGDQGLTRLGDGSEVPKDHPRVLAYGAVDLANSAVGCARAELQDTELASVLEDVQHRLFDLGGTLCVPGSPDSAFTSLLEERSAAMERLMDGWMKVQGPLEEFILPGGSRAAAQLHLARCHFRTAEQFVITLHRKEPLNPATLVYLNRLSDLLFVMAREANRRAGVKDTTWKPANKPK